MAGPVQTLRVTAPIGAPSRRAKQVTLRGMTPTRPPPLDGLIAALNALRLPDLRFEPASDAVLAGLDLQATGNRAYGTKVYVATGRVPNVDRRRLLLGRALAIGASEPHPRGELRCFAERDEVVVAAFAADGAQRGPALRHQPPAGTVLAPGAGFDEALFVWLGPAEDYCTPWSDSAPAVCQVITVERLRQLIA